MIAEDFDFWVYKNSDDVNKGTMDISFKGYSFGPQIHSDALWNQFCMDFLQV